MSDFSRIYKTDLSDRQLMAFWELVQASGRSRTIGFDRPAMDGPAFCRWMRRPGVHPWLVAWRGVPLALCWLSDVQGRSAHVHFCFLPCGTRRVEIPAEAVPHALRQGAARAAFSKENRGKDLNETSRALQRDGQSEGQHGPTAAPQHGPTVAPRRETSPALRSGTLRLPLPRAAALFMLASLLWEVPESGYRLDTLIGVTPQTSRAALAFVRSLGAKEHGIVPGLCWLHDARLNVPGVLTTFNREAVPQRAASL